MSATWILECDNGTVLFTFFAGPNKTQYVEIHIGAERRAVPLWKFNRDMFRVSEEAAKRSNR